MANELCDPPSLSRCLPCIGIKGLRLCDCTGRCSSANSGVIVFYSRTSHPVETAVTGYLPDMSRNFRCQEVRPIYKLHLVETTGYGSRMGRRNWNRSCRPLDHSPGIDRCRHRNDSGIRRARRRRICCGLSGCRKLQCGSSVDRYFLGRNIRSGIFSVGIFAIGIFSIGKTPICSLLGEG